MTHDPALTAAHDQHAAEVRDLVDLVHEHRQSGVCDPYCPGRDAARRVAGLALGVRGRLLIAALIRVDDLQTGVAQAIDAATTPPLDHPWHP